MNDDQKKLIESQALDISKRTVTATSELIKKLNAYLSNFNKSSIFSFSSASSEEYEEKYMLFLSSISNDVSEMTSLNAALASLIIKADKAALIEITLVMQKRFDAFYLFESALYDYTQSMDEILSQNHVSISAIVASAQKFKISAENLIKENA